MSVDLDEKTAEQLVSDLPRMVSQLTHEMLDRDMEVFHRAADRAGQALLELQEMVETGYLVKNTTKQPAQSKTPRVEPQSDTNPFEHVVPGFGAAVKELADSHAGLRRRFEDEHHFDG